METNSSDRDFLRLCLEEARRAVETGNGPVAAIVTKNDREIARGYNLALEKGDPILHGEIVALRNATAQLGYGEINGTLYTNLEPCAMCLMACFFCDIRRVVYSAVNAEYGGVNAIPVLAYQGLQERVQVEQGPFSEESRTLIEWFVNNANTSE